LASFNYVAIDAAGKEVKGNLEAPNKEAGVTSLKQKGLLIISFNAASVMTKDLNISFMEKKPKPRDMSVFCRQFVGIISAGVSIVETLDMLGEQTENPKLKKAIVETKNQVEGGESLANAMRKNKDTFTDIFITMVEAGEASGSLETSFIRMAEQFEKSAKLKATVKKATMYPMVLGIVTVLVVIMLLAFVIPAFEDMFDDLGTELPGLTQAVLNMSHSMTSLWYIYIVAVGGLVFGVIAFRKSPAGKRFFSKLGMKVPVFGKLVVKSASAQMSRTLSTLLSAGLPMIEALEITAATMKNEYFKDALMKTKEEVAMGNNLSEPLTRSKIFPPLVCHMIKIGEETGGIESMLTKLAEYYEDEVDSATQQVTAMLEPLIIVVMAGVVGTLIVAVLMPMATMYGALDSL
jgi:type IV pilus assembly protein PilC